MFQRGNKKSVLEGISPKERQTQRVHEDPCGCCFFFFLLVHWYSYSSNTTHPLVQTLLLPKPCLFWLILALRGCVFIKRGLTFGTFKISLNFERKNYFYYFNYSLLKYILYLTLYFLIIS